MAVPVPMPMAVSLPVAVPVHVAGPRSVARAAAVSVQVTMAVGTAVGLRSAAITLALGGRRRRARRAVQGQKQPHLHLLGVLAGCHHDVHQQIDQGVLQLTTAASQLSTEFCSQSESSVSLSPILADLADSDIMHDTCILTC